MTDTQDQTKQPATEASGGFDSSFAEFASDRASPPAGHDHGPASGGDGAYDPAPADRRDAPPAPAFAGAGTDAADDAQAPSAAATHAPSDDIWARADPALRAAYQAADDRARDAEHKLSSAHGRVAAYQRQLNALRQAQGERSATPEGLDALLGTERIRAFQEDYAEVAEPILDLLRSQQAQLDRMAGPVRMVEENSRQAYYAGQAAILERDHPDWTDYAEHERFAPWLETQPRHVQEAAIRNAQYIEDALEVSDVLSRFKAHIGKGPGAMGRGDGGATDARRAKQLAASADVRTRGPQAAAGAPSEFDSAFEHYARQRGRR